MVQSDVQPMGSPRQSRERSRLLGRLTEAQAALGWGVILILAALLGTIYLTQTSRIATVGRNVQFLQFELEELERQNIALEQAIAESQSLERLQNEARRLGFVQSQPEDNEYIVVEDYPVTATPPPAPLVEETAVLPDPPASIIEATWLHLQGRLNNLIQGEAQSE